MVAFGERLGRAAADGGVIFLQGELGMGKTTLTRGILRAFGHRGAVKSPTYTLVEPYQLDDMTLYHFDLYRLGDPEELEFMGIRDYFTDNSLVVVEWPARGEGFLPEPDLRITITLEGEGRSLKCEAGSVQGKKITALLSQMG